MSRLPARVNTWRSTAVTTAALCCLALGACSSTPAVRLHTLVSAEAPPANAGSAAASPPQTVSLRVAGVPAQVDQLQWLVRQPDDSLLLLEQERWAAPLRDELRAALLQTLSARFNVVDAGDSRDAPAATPAWRVRVDVTRFESLPDREARLDASWSVGRFDFAAASPPPLCRSSLRESVGTGAPALAAGHRRAVAALANAIGRQLQRLQTLPVNATAACPAV